MGEISYLNPNRKKLSAVGEQQTDVIHCLMITLTKEMIILPNSAVAEVVGYLEPEVLEGSPDWFLGRITWRERLVPLISIEQASSSNDVIDKKLKGTRIAILNTLNGNSELPYIAIVAQGIPRLNVIRQEELQTIETLPANRSSIAEIASLNGQEFIIPDIDDLENRILNIH